MADTTNDEWYADGLRFSCTQCGNCCTGPPGYVFFTDDEAEAMATRLELTVGEFRKKHAHKAYGEWSLNETKTEFGYDCIFLVRDEEGKAGCSIYEDRPKQCRTWPFWPENLRSQRNWLTVAKNCPGVADGLTGGGKFYPIDQIRITRDRHR